MSTLNIRHPEIAKQWHPTKNGDLKPEHLSSNSSKKVWWLCSKLCPQGCLHEWPAKISNRTCLGRGCPYCSKPCNKICIHSSIVTTHPKFAKQWHPTKNGNLKAEDFTFGSEKNVWWKCPNTCSYGCLHEWQCRINNRIRRGNGCPFCGDYKKEHCIHQSILYTHPDIVKEWHPTKNGDLKPENFTKGSMVMIHWLCKNKCNYGCLHEWEATINCRTSGHGCAFCIKLKTCVHDSIIYTNPEIMDEWDYELNKEYDPTKINRSSDIVANWKCKKNPMHTWKTKIRNRCYDLTGCTSCINKTESILYNFLIKKFSTVERQFKIESCKNKTYLTFDFYIPELKLIIEIDGLQHFIQISNWQSSEKTRIIDIFKMQKAIKEGYKIIRIFQEDVYNNDESWLLEHLLPEIMSEDRRSHFISTIDSLYDEHIRLLEDGINIIL